jgi:hypothetical protein
MTDEQLVEKLVAAGRRMEREARVAFDDAVEAVRVGTITARDQRALNRWRTAQRRAEAKAQQGSAGLTGAALEQAVMALALRSPEYVVIRGAA